VISNADDNPRAVIIQIQAREKTEPVAFRITTAASILSHFWELRQLHGGNWLTLAEDVLSDGYRIWIDRTFLDQPLIVGLELDTDADPTSCVVEIRSWDGTDGAPCVVYIESSNGG
jgi:hypothetical protein